MTTIASMLHFCRTTPLQGCYFPHFHGALLPARHHLHLQISVLPAAPGDAPITSELACTNLPVSSSFPRMFEMFPSVPTPHPRSHTQLTCIPALPDQVHPCTCTAIAPAHHSVHPTDIRAAQPTAHPTAGAPIPLSLDLGHVPRFRLPSSHVSQSASAPLRSVRCTAHLELSAADAEACAPHLVALVTKLALSALTLPTFDTELLAAAPGALAFHVTRKHAALRLLRPPSRRACPRASHTPHAPPFRRSSLCPSAAPCRARQQPRPRGRSRSQPSALLRDAMHCEHTV
ncbi:hypothetical protein EDB84DRAFT_1193000 [Lactarius hengduanensis]|nr:hypothetical protein EDB84DRAFT_1193000 [Lactarius hengduanensis]